MKHMSICCWGMFANRIAFFRTVSKWAQTQIITNYWEWRPCVIIILISMLDHNDFFAFSARWAPILASAISPCLMYWRCAKLMSFNYGRGQRTTTNAIQDAANSSVHKRKTIWSWILSWIIRTRKVSSYQPLSFGFLSPAWLLCVIFKRYADKTLSIKAKLHIMMALFLAGAISQATTVTSMLRRIERSFTLRDRHIAWTDDFWHKPSVPTSSLLLTPTCEHYLQSPGGTLWSYNLAFLSSSCWNRNF